MKFTKVLGNCDQKIITEAENKLTAVFSELSLKYNDKGYVTRLGGDILLYQLLYPLPHICDTRAIEFETTKKSILTAYNNKTISIDQKIEQDKALSAKFDGKHLLYTAATNGRIYWWNPEFICSKSIIGVRLVVGHEGNHSIYMHPQRRGSRLPSLWNIAVDFKVNYNLLEDLRLRGFYDYVSLFKKELGDYITINEYAAFLKDPYNPPAKLSHWNPLHSIKSIIDPAYAKPIGETYFYADPKLSKDLKKPENIYDHLFSQIPKCSCCGKVGHYKKPDEMKKLMKQLKEMKSEK